MFNSLRCSDWTIHLVMILWWSLFPVTVSSTTTTSSSTITTPASSSSVIITSVVAELQLHLPGFFVGSSGQLTTVSLQPMSLQIQLRPEHHELLFLALRLRAEIVILVKVVAKVRILGVKVLETISITEVTEIMIFAKMFEQLLVINKPLVTELAERMTCEQLYIKVFKIL